MITRVWPLKYQAVTFKPFTGLMDKPKRSRSQTHALSSSKEEATCYWDEIRPFEGTGNKLRTASKNGTVRLDRRNKHKMLRKRTAVFDNAQEKNLHYCYKQMKTRFVLHMLQQKFPAMESGAQYLPDNAFATASRGLDTPTLQLWSQPEHVVTK